MKYSDHKNKIDPIQLKMQRLSEIVTTISCVIAIAYCISVIVWIANR